MPTVFWLIDTVMASFVHKQKPLASDLTVYVMITVTVTAIVTASATVTATASRTLTATCSL